MKKNLGVWMLGLLIGASALASPPPIPVVPGVSLNAWWFNDTNLITAKGTLPRGYYGVQLTPSWQSNAVTVAGPSALLQYNEIETNGVTNMVCDNGTLMLFFSPQWNSGLGPGVCGRLIEMGQYTTNASFGWWSIYVDPFGSWIYFGTQTNGAGSNILAAPISWQSNTWHHVALTYTATNSALYVDGQIATNGGGVVHYPGPIARWTNGLAIGSDTSGANVANGTFDWMQTYNYPVSGNTISNLYQRMAQKHPALAGSGGGGSLQSAPGGFDDPMFMGGGEGSLASEGLRLVLQPAGATVRLILYGSVPGAVYSIYSKPNLSAASWTFERNVTGAAGEDWTDTFIPMNGRPMLFLRVASSDDADGDGLSDAEELFITGTDPANPDTGNTGIADGYKDPDQDGWTNIDEMRNGTNPNAWNTPAPFLLRITSYVPRSTASMGWEPPSLPVAVSEYVIERDTQSTPDFEEVARLSPNATHWTDTQLDDYDPNYPGWPLPIAYRVTAVHANGRVQVSSVAITASQENEVQTAVVRGPEGRLYLVASHIPQHITSFRVERIAGDVNYPLADVVPGEEHGQAGWNGPAISYLEIPVSAFQNGVFKLPLQDFPPYAGYRISVQPRSHNGQLGLGGYAGPDLISWYRGQVVMPFLDGQIALKQNLMFLLRAARGGDGRPFLFGLRPDYVVSHFYHLDDPRGFLEAELNEFEPFQANYLYRNWVFSPDDIRSGTYPHGFFDTGLTSDGNGFNPYLDPPPKYMPRVLALASGSDTSLLTPQMPVSPSMPVYIGFGFFTSEQEFDEFFADWYNCGLSASAGQLSLASGFNNIFGSRYNSVKISRTIYDLGPNQHTDLAGGSSAPLPECYGEFFQDIQIPTLQTVSYYFAPRQRDPRENIFPGHPAFNINATTPLVIASVGKTIGVAGWAKQSINGSQTRFAYLGQYFDKAYKANPDGTRSTTETGILSEYGEFFPTEPGRVILTTKPDIDTGAVGECTVHVIGLSVDANHDGEMDETFSGPDQTHPGKPYVFWANGDWDRDNKDQTIIRADRTLNYISANIDCERDLEDFSRLWFSGLPPLPAADGYEVLLQWRNVTGNPAINLYKTCESDGGTRYLQDDQVAFTQTHTAPYYASINPLAQPIGYPLEFSPRPVFTFPADYFATEGANRYFLFAFFGLHNG